MREYDSMHEDACWSVIASFDWEEAGDDDAVLEPAVNKLVAWSEEDIFAFHDFLAEKLHALDTREHCRHCYLGELDPDDGDDYISADGFLYARCVVVANGRDYFRKVLATPSAMPQGLEFEALLSLAATAYEQKTGRAFEREPAIDFESFQNAAGWAPSAQTRPGKYTGENVPVGNRRPVLVVEIRVLEERLRRFTSTIVGERGGTHEDDEFAKVDHER